MSTTSFPRYIECNINIKYEVVCTSDYKFMCENSHNTDKLAEYMTKRFPLLFKQALTYNYKLLDTHDQLLELINVLKTDIRCNSCIRCTLTIQCISCKEYYNSGNINLNKYSNNPYYCTYCIHSKNIT